MVNNVGAWLMKNIKSPNSGLVYSNKIVDVEFAKQDIIAITTKNITRQNFCCFGYKNLRI